MKPRLSDRILRRWLATGRPSRVGRHVESDPAIAARLDALTALTGAQAGALEDLVTPEPRFEHRTAIGVQQRVAAYEAASTMLDLLGLGFHVGRAVLGDRGDDHQPLPGDTDQDQPSE